MHIRDISTILVTLLLTLTLGAGSALAFEAIHSNEAGEALATPGVALSPIIPFTDGLRDSCDCIDLMFVLDSTGSMGGAINNVKAGLASILALADTWACGDLQAGVAIFYDDVHVLQSLTMNLGDVTAALNSVSASGGNGWPEASDEALRELGTASACLTTGDFDPAAWRPNCCKIAILVTDATPGGCDDTFITGTDDVNAHQRALDLAGLGVQVGAIYVLSEVVPDPVTAAIMQDYATTTGGVYTTVPHDGSGTAASIEQMILDCAGGPADTELCCVDENCITVLQGQCDAMGGTLVTDCNDCGSVATESSSFSTIKTLY